jgi:hypothetical protein
VDVLGVRVKGVVMTPDEILARALALADRFEHDYTPTVDTSTPEMREHLRNHLTDGRWHDSCKWCYRRRVEGGTGVRR